jgi:hypothetical protein
MKNDDNILKGTTKAAWIVGAIVLAIIIVAVKYFIQPIFSTL